MAKIKSFIIKNPKILLYFSVVAFTMFFHLLVRIYMNGSSDAWLFSDIDGQWKICNLTLNGIDPYLLVGKEIDFGFSAAPWACVLQNVFYLGFAPLEIARIYVISLQVVLYIICAIVLYKRFFSKLNCVYLCLIISVWGQHNFYSCFRNGNCAVIVCFLVFISLFIIKKYPIASGVLLGFAMIKPQITGIICLVILLNKNWRSIFVAFIVVVCGFTITLFLLDVSIIDLFKEFVAAGTSVDTHYYGLFTFLSYFALKPEYIMLLSCFIGIVYAICFWKATNKNQYLSYAGAVVASTFWTYKVGNDYFILIYICALLLVFGLTCNISLKLNIFNSLCIVYLQLDVVLIKILQNWLSFGVFAYTIDAIILSVILVWTIYLWRKYDKFLPKNHALRSLN